MVGLASFSQFLAKVDSAGLIRRSIDRLHSCRFFAVVGSPLAVGAFLGCGRRRAGATGFASAYCAHSPIQGSDWQSVNKWEIRELLSWRVEQIPACAGPLPVDGSRHQSTANWVLVDIVDCRLDRIGSVKISVVTRSLLPEAEAGFARTFLDREPIDKRRLRANE